MESIGIAWELCKDKRDSLKIDTGDLKKLDDLMRWMEHQGFTTGSRPSTSENEIRLNIYYSYYSILIMSINATKTIDIKKTHTAEENTQKIQVAKIHFDKYWVDNIQKYTFSWDELDQIKDNLQDIKKLFIDDVVLNFNIKAIRLRNFRCYENDTFHFKPGFNLLIGNNGSGKTSLIDALTVAIGGFLRGINELKPTEYRYIQKSDIRYIKKVISHSPSTDTYLPVEVECEAEFIDKPIKWTRILSNKRTTGEATTLTNIVQQIEEDVKAEKNQRTITLPIFSYHAAGRLDNFANDMKLIEKTENISRFFGYNKCLEKKADYNTFVAWYRKMRLHASELNIRIPVFEAVAKGIDSCMRIMLENDSFWGNFDSVKLLEGELCLLFDNGIYYPLSDLSDGYQDIVATVSDIAYRMAILNPHLEDNVLKLTPGVVFIDEIDLHLHPGWQRKIIKMLKSVFPGVQFVATTHSPIILSSTDEGEAFELVREGDKLTSRPIGNPKMWYFADILSEAFHIEPDAITKDKEEEFLDIEHLLKSYSDMVKGFLINPREDLRAKIKLAYERLILSFPPDTPKRKLIESLWSVMK